jgi:tRNA (Thr-GGU) A37 N-methylase
VTITVHRDVTVTSRAGLSLARLDRVEMRRGGGVALHLSGVDLVDGTPVLDVKPWLPLDSPAAGSWVVPEW